MELDIIICLPGLDTAKNDLLHLYTSSNNVDCKLSQEAATPQLWNFTQKNLRWIPVMARKDWITVVKVSMTAGKTADAGNSRDWDTGWQPKPVSLSR